MSKPIASVSLDLDNKWSYLQSHGDPGWETFPSYLDLVVPRVLQTLGERGLRITFFVVGQDAALEKNAGALRAIADSGHEIANHSFTHQPWLHLFTPEQVADELSRTEEALERVTGQRPIGFRGPGFSTSPEVHRQLAERGYQYDASTFPTYIAPLARAYFFLTARLSAEERRERAKLYGSWRQGFGPLRPYMIAGLGSPLVELPVTTAPVLKSPIHFTYLHYLAGYSVALAKAYFDGALRACDLAGIEPSLLLHPLDFMGKEDDAELGFFPAMKQPAAKKCELAAWALDRLGRGRRLVTIEEHAAEARRRLLPRAVEAATPCGAAS